MPVVNLEALGKLVDIPENARRLLSKSEKEIRCTLSFRVDHGQIIEADCYVVYHNLVRGPAKGGIRMDASVTMEETRDLAERMTYKSALVGIPFGGGKSGIRLDPGRLSRFEKTALIREYCHVLRHELEHGEYIPAPDMGTNPTDMAVVYGRVERLDSVTGKPPRVGGLPGRKEATGKGVAHICHLYSQLAFDGSLQGKRVAVQGFGNVGNWTARFLAEAGARVIAVSDISGGVLAEEGLPVAEFCDAVANGHLLKDVTTINLGNEELLGLDVDFLIPAAAGDQLAAHNADRVKARCVVEGANGPTTPEADEILEGRGITVLPDILSNAGGVVASYVEWRNAKSGSITEEAETYETITHTLGKAFRRTMELARKCQVSPRTAAQAIGVSEVVEAMKDRNWI